MAGPLPSVKEPHLAGRWYPVAPAELGQSVRELLDAEATAALARVPLVRPNPAVFMREHALEIQLPLLQGLAPECALVPLLVGSLEPGDAVALAAALRSLLEPGTLLVASSDLTHYGRRFDYLPVPPTDAATVAAAVRRLDEGALEHIVAHDADGFVAYVQRTGATICGRSPIEVVLRALPAGARGERLPDPTPPHPARRHRPT